MVVISIESSAFVQSIWQQSLTLKTIGVYQSKLAVKDFWLRVTLSSFYERDYCLEYWEYSVWDQYLEVYDFPTSAKY